MTQLEKVIIFCFRHFSLLAGGSQLTFLTQLEKVMIFRYRHFRHKRVSQLTFQNRLAKHSIALTHLFWLVGSYKYDTYICTTKRTYLILYLDSLVVHLVSKHSWYCTGHIRDLYCAAA